MLVWHIHGEKFISLSSLQFWYHRNLIFSLKNGFVVLLIVEKSCTELVAAIREGQPLCVFMRSSSV